MKTNKITFLQIIEDNEYDYIFHPLEVCSSVAHAIATAWKRHDDFLESDEGKDYKLENCTIISENDFVKRLASEGMINVTNNDRTCRRIYKLITIEITTSVSVVSVARG